MDEIGSHSVRKSPGLFPTELKKKLSAMQAGAGWPGPSPGPAQSGPGWHTAEAGPGLGPDQAWSHESHAFFRSMVYIVWGWIRLQNWDLDAPIPPNCAEFRSASDGTSHEGSRHDRKFKKWQRVSKLRLICFGPEMASEWSSGRANTAKMHRISARSFWTSSWDKKIKKKMSTYVQILPGVGVPFKG